MLWIVRDSRNAQANIAEGSTKIRISGQHKQQTFICVSVNFTAPHTRTHAYGRQTRRRISSHLAGVSRELLSRQAQALRTWAIHGVGSSDPVLTSTYALSRRAMTSNLLLRMHYVMLLLCLLGHGRDVFVHTCSQHMLKACTLQPRKSYPECIFYSF